MRTCATIRTLIVAMAVAAGAHAHHSFATFDLTKEVALQGVVKRVEWMNPHIWINVMITNANGNTEEWGIEAGATNTMNRQGWKRDSIKAGDRVKVQAHPMRNGSHTGSLISITLPDGRVLTLGAQGARKPY
jgi:hypothetical protein